MSTPAPKRTRAPKASLVVQAVPADEPMTDLDRWVEQLARSVAKMEGIPLPPGAST